MVDDIRARLAACPLGEFKTISQAIDYARHYARDVDALLTENAELEEEREAISALFPDDATHKHAQTGESLYDNIQDALRGLDSHRRRGDHNFVEWQKTERRIAALEKALRAQQCKCPVLLKCPHCGGDVVEGVDQFSGSWICGACVKTVNLPKDSARQCIRCAALAGDETGAEKD